MSEIRVATRASALARAQTGWVRGLIADALGTDASEVLVTSEGDTSMAALSSFGGRGVFVAAVRQAVINGRADVAVHSMKDLPTADDPRAMVVAVPPREDPRDFVVAQAGGLDDLPAGATVATGSVRRAAFLLRSRPDLQIVGIRGNVDSRVAKVADGTVDAVVLAVAGLRRLGLTPPGFTLSVDEMLPAVGQGALAVEMRSDDPRMDAVAGIGDETAAAVVVAERALLAGLRAGCSAPVGVSTTCRGDQIELRAAVLSADGSKKYECKMSGALPLARTVGQRAAQHLIGQGADRLLRR